MALFCDSLLLMILTNSKMLRAFILAFTFLTVFSDVSYSDTPAVNLEAETSTSKPLSVLLVAGLYSGHLFPLVSLGEELVRRGHNVTLCANVMRGSHLYPDVPERVGIKFVSAGYDELFTQDYYEEIHAAMATQNSSFDFTALTHIIRIGQSSFLKVRNKIEEIGVDRFDIVVGESSMYSIVAYLHRKGIKTVVLSTLMAWPQATLPSWPTPIHVLGQIDDLSFVDRLLVAVFNPIRVHFLEKAHQGIIQRESAYMQKLQGLSVPLIFNTVFGLDYPKPRYPLMEYVGPVLMNSLPQLDESLQEWLDSRQERTVIYISMGTTGLLSVEITTALLEGVMATPYHAVWVMKKRNRDSLGEVDFEAYQDRLYLAEWVPQQTVLQHRAILMTILHCGFGGVQESLYNCLPVICLPCVYDQFEVGAKVVGAGVGISLLTLSDSLTGNRDVKSETITYSIHRIVSDNYAENASRISRMYKFAGGAKRAADLVEFYEDVGYEHLVPSFVKYKWSWVQYYNVDVWLVMVVTCGVLGWLVWRIVLKCVAIVSSLYKT